MLVDVRTDQVVQAVSFVGLNVIESNAPESRPMWLWMEDNKEKPASHLWGTHSHLTRIASISTLRPGMGRDLQKPIKTSHSHKIPTSLCLIRFDLKSEMLSDLYTSRLYHVGRPAIAECEREAGA